MSAAPLIECDDLTVNFGTTRALDRVSMSARPGEIVGLVGPNGAGKSTLGRVFVGELPFGFYEGTLKFKGNPVHFRDSREANHAGIVLVHQEGAAIEQLSIGENVMLTLEPTIMGRIDWRALHDRAGGALAQLGISANTHTRLDDVGGLALVELVEIARSIVRGSSVFVFDESTAALGAEEIRILLKRMREIAARGAAIVFISHRIDEVLGICDRIVVLRDGRIVLDEQRAGHDHASVMSAMLGTASGPQRAGAAPVSDANFASSPSKPVETAALHLSGWRVPKSEICRVDVGPIDIDVQRGEVVGLFGPLGAGKTELLGSLFGLFDASPSGQLFVDGQSVQSFSGPEAAMRYKVAFVSSDRQKEGIVPQLSVLENMVLGYHRAELTRKSGILNHKKCRQICENLIAELGIQTMGPEQQMSMLSGGNQQKVLLARALINSPRILLLDEPTRGIDVGAKQDVYRWMRATAASGAAILVSSLEEDELLRITHKILVIRDGRQLAILETDKTNERELLMLAAGGSPA